MLDVSKEEYEEIFKAAEIDLTTTKTRTKTRNIVIEEEKADKAGVKKEFSLPGRIELETFFKDYVIDVVENSEYYKRMGIEFPSPFILQGPPG